MAGSQLCKVKTIPLYFCFDKRFFKNVVIVEFYQMIFFMFWVVFFNKFSFFFFLIDEWFIRIGHLWGLQAGKWEMPHPKNSLGYSFIIKGKVGSGRRTSLSFLSRCHGSIISSFSRLSRGVFLFLHCLTGSTNHCFSCVQRTCPRDDELTELTGQMWVSCHHCFMCGACPVFLLHGFVAKQGCLFNKSPNVKLFLYSWDKSFLIVMFDHVCWV